MKKEEIVQSVKLSDIKNGGLTGLMTILLIQPFQVIKTSMIVIYNKQRRLKMLDVIKQIKSEEGLFGFYRGFLPSVVKAIFGYSIFFGSLEFNKTILKKTLNYSYNKNNSIIKEKKDEKIFNFNEGALNFLASGMARTIQALSVSPILVIKTRSEVLGFNSYNNLFDAFKKIKKEEGIRGFYAGLRTTLLKDVPASGLFYMSYEFIKKKIENFGIKNIQIQAILSSTITSFILVVMTNPLEVIRTRQQYQHFSTNPDHNYNNISHGVLRIYEFEGIKGFFVGIAPRLMKKGFGSVIVWTVYESLKTSPRKLSIKL